MAVRVLDAVATATLLSRHPDIRADAIPSYGVRVVDDFEGQGDKDYLIGLVHETGEVKAIDLTAYNQYWFDLEGPGQRIDPADPASLTDFEAFLKGLADPFVDVAQYVFYAAVIFGGIWLINRAK